MNDSQAETTGDNQITCRLSDKTDALTIKTTNEQTFLAIKQFLTDKYVFNRNKNGIDTHFSINNKKIVITIYNNTTIFVQGRGCYEWKQSIFDPMLTSMATCSESVFSESDPIVSNPNSNPTHLPHVVLHSFLVKSLTNSERQQES